MRWICGSAQWRAISVALLAHGEIVPKRDDHKAGALDIGRSGRTVRQQRLHTGGFIGRQRRVGGHEMQVLGTDAIDVRIDALEGGKQALLAEGGQRESAGKAREMRHGGQGRQ